MVVRDFGTPEQRTRYLDRSRYPHAALCLTEPPPGAGVDALTLTGCARLLHAPSGAGPLLDVEKRGRFISHMEFADFVLLAVESGDPRLAGGCVFVAEPGDEGVFDRGLPVRTLGHRLSSVTSPAFRLRLPASRILGGYTVEGDRLAPQVGYREALEPALRRCRPVVALMTAGKLLATMEAVLALGLPDLAAALRLVDAWAGAEAAASLGLEAARISDRLDAGTPSPAALSAEGAVMGAAARLFATAHAAQRMAQYRGMPDVLGRLMDTQVEAVYLGAESVQRRLLAASMAAPGFPSRLAAWAAEAE
jgi:alkylation response protein AidB-like acyl-CoA dehydrogenase